MSSEQSNLVPAGEGAPPAVPQNREPLLWEEALSGEAWSGPGAPATSPRSTAPPPARRGMIAHEAGVSTCRCCGHRWAAQVRPDGRLRSGAWTCAACDANGSGVHGRGCPGGYHSPRSGGRRALGPGEA